MDCNDITPFTTYILSNYKKTVLYIGVTNDLNRRVLEHKSKIDPNSFTAKYNVDRLVYFEKFQSVNDAIAREKQLKHCNHNGKRELSMRRILSGKICLIMLKRFSPARE